MPSFVLWEGRVTTLSGTCETSGDLLFPDRRCTSRVVYQHDGQYTCALIYGSNNMARDYSTITSVPV